MKLNYSRLQLATAANVMSTTTSTVTMDESGVTSMNTVGRVLIASIY